MIKSVKEIASSSNVLAPVFRFREYVRGQEYFNNGRIIDFVTDHNSLYVPVTDSIPEQTTDTGLRNGFGFGMPTMPTIPTIPTFDGECHGVKAIADSPAEDPNFMLLVSKGSQGEPGPKGNPGKDGKTPSVFARFDGKQMVFYTMEYVDGVPTTKRIAATNDLTGPAWKPEVINDTIVWRKSKDDEAPKSIPLDELRAKEAPVLLRVNSDNTKREDETSGPANYIQWKYEGEDYWNNLISISELMNLTLAGVTIFPVENEETGKVEYHLGHKEVTKATYDSTETGKRIITEVELGEVLFDAGKIPFPEYTYDYDIAWLKSENCERKREIDAIERELPKFVRSVNGNRPDEEGNVEIEIPDAYTKEESDDRYQPKGNYQPAGDYAPAGDYIKKSDLQFEVRVTEGEGRYLWVTMDGGNSWTKVMEATCACQQVEPCVVNSITLPQNVSGEIGELVCLEAQIDSTGPCEDLEITWISDNQNMPVDENGCVTINEAGEAHITAVAGGKQASTTVIGRAPETTLSVNPTSLSFDAEPTASKTITVTTNANTYDVSADCEWITPTKSGNTITVAAGDNNGAARTCTITITAGDKIKTVSVSQDAYVPQTKPVEYVRITEGATAEMCKGESHTFTATAYPTDATDRRITWSVSNQNAATVNETTGQVTIKNDTTASTVTVTATAMDGSNEYYDCVITINTCADPCEVTSVTLNKSTISTTEGGYPETLEATVVSTGECEDITWTTSDDTVIELHDSENNNIKWIYPVGSGTATVTASLGGKSATCEITVERRYETYTLTINENGGSAEYKVDDNPWYGYEQPIVLVENTSVEIKATKEGFTPTFKDADTNEVIENPFIMTKDTSINITWTEQSPQTYTVTANKNGGNCSNKPDTLTISKTQNGTYSSELTFNAGTTNTVYVRATKSGKVDKYWTESVNGETVITLDSSDAPGCSWEDEAVPCSVSTVTVSPSTLTLNVGQTNTLSKTINSTGDCDNTVTWSSTNTSVATVDQNGKVTAVGAGTATIKATSDDSENKVGQCAVTVTSPITYNLTVRNNLNKSISAGITTAGTTITAGNERDFDVSSAYDSGSFSIDVGDGPWYAYYYVNGSLIKIDEATAAMGNQEASFYIRNITFEGSGSNYYQIIEVSDADPGGGSGEDVAVTGVTLNLSNATLRKVCSGTEDSVELIATVLPENASRKIVSWQVTNPGTVVNITPNNDRCVVKTAQMAGGRAIVTVTTADGGFTATCEITVEDSMIINKPSLDTATGDSDLYLLPLGQTYQLTTRTLPANASVTWTIDGSASNSGISVSNSGLVTGTKIGAGIAIATNASTGCQDNVRFQVYDEEDITIDSVEMESDGLDWINGEVCSSVSGYNDTGYQLDYLIYAVDSDNSRPTGSSPEQDINLDVAVGVLNQNCEEFNIERSFFGNKQYAYILVRDHFNNSIKDESWYRIPEPEN